MLGVLYASCTIIFISFFGKFFFNDFVKKYFSVPLTCVSSPYFILIIDRFGLFIVSLIS